jgi:SAM-dependent methyltransferase
MLELLDPKSLDPIAYDDGMLEAIRDHSLLPEKRIGWHYVMDYTWLAVKFDELFVPGMRVVDIGCGPGAVHGYLESRYGTDILGLDMEKWERDYVDVQGDFCDPELRRQLGIAPGSLDMIISASAFEHNPPEAHRRLIDVCLETLKPGGILLTTFAAARDESHFFKPTHQWNLTRRDIEILYGVWERWRTHREMAEGCRKRFGRFTENDPPYISAAAMIRKAA